MSKKTAADVSRRAGEEDWCVHTPAYSSFGRMTLSITWMTPLLAAMSVFTTFAPSTVTPPALSREAPYRAAAFLEHSKKAAAEVFAGAGEEDCSGHDRSGYSPGGSRTRSMT